MTKFEKVKKFYLMGFWSKNMVKNAVKKKWITSAQYEEITGEAYSA